MRSICPLNVVPTTEPQVSLIQEKIKIVSNDRNMSFIVSVIVMGIKLRMNSMKLSEVMEIFFPDPNLLRCWISVNETILRLLSLRTPPDFPEI